MSAQAGKSSRRLLSLATRVSPRLGRSVRSIRRRLQPPPPRCSSLREWAVATPGAAVELVRPQLTVLRPHPNMLPSADHGYEYFLSFEGEYVVPDRYLARIPGGRLIGGDGLLMLPDGSVSTESVYEHLYGESQLTEAARSARAQGPVIEGNYFSLLNRFAADHNYYHWLQDVLVPLYDVVDHLPDDVRFVVPRERRPYQDESLAAIGVSAERLWEVDGTGAVTFEHLYAAPPLPLTVNCPPAEIWFRDQVLTAYALELGPRSRRVYISRRGARHRRVVNEDQVEAMLGDYGFEVCRPEELTFPDQVALFADAEMVVCAHGAGLTNMVFAPPGLVVVDIFESNRFNKYYWNLTATLGHHYWPVAGTPVPSGAAYADDLTMDLSVLRQVVDRSLVRKTGE